MARGKKETNGAAEANGVLTERIEIPLDAKEVAALGLELAEARLEHSTLKEEKHQKDKSYNEKLNVLDDKIQELAQAVKDHVKFETIAVTHKFDEKNQEVKIYRDDNGKHIRTRPMNEKEISEINDRKQLSIFDAAPKGEKVTHNGQSLTKTKANKRKSKKSGAAAAAK